MKHKFLFAAQVFSVLILFFAIFAAYLLRDESKGLTTQGKNELLNTKNADRRDATRLYLNSI